MIVNDKFFLTKGLYDLHMYAIVGAQWAKALKGKTLNIMDFYNDCQKVKLFFPILTVWQL